MSALFDTWKRNRDALRKEVDQRRRAWTSVKVHSGTSAFNLHAAQGRAIDVMEQPLLQPLINDPGYELSFITDKYGNPTGLSIGGQVRAYDAGLNVWDWVPTKVQTRKGLQLVTQTVQRPGSVGTRGNGGGNIAYIHKIGIAYLGFNPAAPLTVAGYERAAQHLRVITHQTGWSLADTERLLATVVIVAGIVVGATAIGAASAGSTGAAAGASSTAATGGAAAAGGAGAASGGITVVGSSTGLTTGVAAVDTVASTAASGAVLGGANSAIKGGSAAQGAQQGAQQGAVQGAGQAGQVIAGPAAQQLTQVIGADNVTTVKEWLTDVNDNLGVLGQINHTVQANKPAQAPQAPPVVYGPTGNIVPQPSGGITSTQIIIGVVVLSLVGVVAFAALK